MHSSPETVAALLLLLGGACLIGLVAVAPRPSPDPGATLITESKLDSKPRVHERDPSARRTPRRPAGRRNARPASTPAPVLPPEEAPQREAATTPPPQPPRTVVETFYRALDARRFEDAWTLLSPAVHAAFGGFERWRDGYATTLSSSPRDIEVAVDGTAATIAHELVTEDRSSCGPVRRRFAVTWRLVLGSDGWRASSLSGVKRSGPEPAEACAERHDAARAAGGV